MFKGEERIINIPGFTLTAREWGPPDGIPVLAIHGWLDNASSFEFLAPLLPNLHIIAIDLPGCGHSSHKPISSIPSLIEDPFYMFQVASKIGWEKFSIIGHSRGGVVGQLMASGWPDRIQSLVLLDISGFFLTGTEAQCVEHWSNSFHKFFTPKVKPATLYPDLATAATERMKTYPIDFESALALTVRGTKKVEGGYIWTFDRRELVFRSPIKFSYDMVKAMLASIKAPTCFILAEDGYVKYDPKTASLYPQQIPNHTIHFVPGGHHVHMDNPKVVAPLILDFFTKNSDLYQP